jgi:hypothetical protein
MPNERKILADLLMTATTTEESLRVSAIFNDSAQNIESKAMTKEGTYTHLPLHCLINLFVRSFVCLFVYLFVCEFVCLFVCLFVRVLVCSLTWALSTVKPNIFSPLR